MIKIAILVPVFNNLEYTKICLSNLVDTLNDIQVQQVLPNIIVVDDGSTDGTREWIKSHFSNIEVLFGTGNLWWSGSINLGMEHAFEKQQADHVLWWNNDIIAGGDYFNNLFNLIKEASDDTVYGSKIYQAGNPNIVWGMGGYFDPVNGKKGMHAFNVPDSPAYNDDLNVQWLPGMGTIINKSVYNKIGLLDNTHFPQYHGDSDYTYRAYLANFKIIVKPSLKIYNHVENTGLQHGYKLGRLIKSFSSIKSKYNIKKNILFYKYYAKSIKAYGFLFKEYFRYVGGFVKWKFLNLLGIRKHSTL
jgi:GT2 family glycosyltransferase